MRAGRIVREQGLDIDESLTDTGADIEQFEAALAPGEPGDRRAADRLLADQLLVDAVREQEPGGARQLAVEEGLIRYAMPVLISFLRTGEIVGKLSRLGCRLGDSVRWPDFTAADREEFAQDMIADGLPRFARFVFEEGRWSPARRASLKTFFVNTCVWQFPPLYRKWCRNHGCLWPVGLEVDVSGGDHAPDPAIEVALRDEVDWMLEKIADPRLKKVLVFRGAGYTAVEAAGYAGLNPRTADSRMTRIRKDLRSERENMEPPDSTRPDTSQGGRWGK